LKLPGYEKFEKAYGNNEAFYWQNRGAIF